MLNSFNMGLISCLHIAGVNVGDTFYYRTHITVAGGMKEMNAGIDIHQLQDGTEVACAVCLCFECFNREVVIGDPNALFFSGQGGLDETNSKVVRCYTYLSSHPTGRLRNDWGEP